MAKGAAPPAIPRPDHWGRKVMYTIFFDAHGPVCQICTPKGRTVTGNFYATVVLPTIKNHYLERRPRCGLFRIHYISIATVCIIIRYLELELELKNVVL